MLNLDGNEEPTGAEDVKGIIRTQGAHLDRAYFVEWVGDYQHYLQIEGCNFWL